MCVNILIMMYEFNEIKVSLAPFQDYTEYNNCDKRWRNRY